MKKIEINHNDDYKIFDKLAFSANKHRCGPLGWVQVYLDNKKVHDGPNLVTAIGREFVAQKIFENILYLNDESIEQQREDFRGYKISHFAVGSGGSTVEGEQVTLLGPEVCDTGLYKPISLGDVSFLNEPGNSSDLTELHKKENSLKPILFNEGSVYLEPREYIKENSNLTCTNYTRVKCTCIVEPGYPSALTAGQSVQISEAGLYFVNPQLNPITPKLFAHICFSPKYKELESKLTIYWYILC